jgi:predicted metal-dependent phosphoesterase TrpH
LPLKVELHSHTSDDPVDVIPHDAPALIDRAAALGYQALAITLHERYLDPMPLIGYAAARGIVLIPGVERTIEGKHVLLIGFSAAAERVSSFDDLAHLRHDERGIVVAPHPFFPEPSCLGRQLERHPELFDAVEVNAFYSRALDFNRRAIRWAEQHGKPLVGNGDVHRLTQLGTTWSLVDADPEPQAICDAIRAGRVEVQTSPITLVKMATLLADIVSVGSVRRFISGPSRARSGYRPDPSRTHS